MKPIYGAGHFLSQVFFDLFFRGQVSGTEWIPKTGPFILAANHASFFDPPGIGCRVPREIYYFARKTLFKPGLPEKILHSVNTIPVDLESEADVSALKSVFRVVKGGNGILLFPEGTRSEDGDFRLPQPGVGMIACKTAVPVVPARIFGSYEAFGRHKKYPQFYTPVDVGFAPPLSPGDYDRGGKGRERYQAASEAIMKAICRIPPPPRVGI